MSPGKRKQCVWLTSASYSERAREVVLELSGPKAKMVKRFPFLPKAVLNSVGAPAGEITGMLDRKSFSVSAQKNSVIVTASDFSELRRAVALLERALGSKALMPSPERQFLAENNYSYFDCFAEFGEGGLARQQFCLPRMKTSIDLKSLPETLRLLLAREGDLGERLMEKITLSNLLCQPLERVPESKFAAIEQFLDIARFRARQPLPFNPKLPLEGFKPREPEWQPQNFTEIDFSQVWPVLLTFPFYNLGPDSIDCECCKPQSPSDRNVLPSSLALAGFSSDGLYFESSLPSFAAEFHSSEQFAAERRRFMQEWGMRFPPLGPFFAGQSCHVPVQDALRLEAQGKCAVLGFGQKPHWFCQKNESFLGKEIAELNRRIASLERIMRAKERRSVSSRGIAGIAFLEGDLHYRFFRSSLSVLDGVFKAIPLHLCAPLSRHYEPALASAIEAVQGSVLHSFREFARQDGSRSVQSGNSKALLDSELCLATAKDFSKKHGIPAPEVKGKRNF